MTLLHNIKICGVTEPHTARFVAASGFGAIGFVFYENSPRRVTPRRARALETPGDIARVGVFVNAPFDEIRDSATTARLTTIQLHGNESPALAQRLCHAGFRVVKTIRAPGDAARFPAHIGILIEAGRGALPGGNGAAWDWRTARELAQTRPVAIAGGITPENFSRAVAESGAVAFDISSGAESRPGIKDHTKISSLVRAANARALQTSFWKK